MIGEHAGYLAEQNGLGTTIKQLNAEGRLLLCTMVTLGLALRLGRVTTKKEEFTCPHVDPLADLC